MVHEKQVDIEDAAREAEILESKVDELKALKMPQLKKRKMMLMVRICHRTRC